MGDYSTTITIINQTSYLLGLTASHASEGSFTNLPNIIEAGETQDIRVKDSFGFEGSAGTCTYEVHDDNHDGSDPGPSFTLDFADPFSPGGVNFCKISYASSGVVGNIRPYQTSGHPFSATVEIHSSSNVVFTANHVVKSTSMAVKHEARMAKPEPEEAKEAVHIPQNVLPIKAMYHIGFKTLAGAVDMKPIHETIAIAAFINSKVYTPKGTEYSNLSAKQWEFIRGVIWDDDPSCLLFNDKSDDNHSFGIGWDWWTTFEGSDDRSMTRRSHFGDLQFLHAMATVDAEPAQTTKNKCLQWLEVIYRLSIGEGISEQDQLSNVFKGSFFTNTSETPAPSASLKDLIVATTPHYQAIDLKKRALGICLHIIADSYAVGHVRRAWLNPQDLDRSAPNGEIKFKEGTYGKAGSVLTFHTYKGQNSDTHKHYDDLLDKEMPKPSNLDSFNHILGSRDAIERSTKLINFWHAKTAWKQGVEQFFSEEVFKLDPNVTVADTKVD